MEHKMKKKIVMSVLGLYLAVLLVSSAYAAGVTLAWNAPTGGGTVKGYNLYYGTSNGNFPNKVSGINNTQHIISGLAEDKVYYFVVKAYNDQGESGPSNMITWKYSDTTPPLPPFGVQAQ